ncbi:MAG: hypothetical protein ACP5HU_09900 [Phycisphaerae bacterium]
MEDLRDNLDRIRRRLWFEFRKDARKTAVAGGLAVLVLVLAVKLVLSGPSTSQAADASVGDAAAANESDAWAVVEADPWEQSKQAEYVRSIDRNIQRDIFRPQLTAFPIEGDGAGSDTSLETCEGEDIEESRSRRVEGEAQSLRLESTAVSATPTAIINGKVLMEGETINGFRIVEIKPHACLIEKEGVRIRLRMKS